MSDSLTILNSKTENSCYEAFIAKGPTLPIDWKRGGQAGGNLDGSVVIAGGTNWGKDRTTKYWLNTTLIFRDGKWSLGPNLPQPVGYPSFATDKNGLYIAGGYNSEDSVSNSVYEINSLNQGWKSLPTLPVKVGFGAGAILNGRLYIACGSDESKMSNEVWELDLHNTKGKWERCEPIPGPARILPAMVACGGYLYLLGGLAEFSPLTPLNDAYQYDPATNQWKRLGNLPLKGYAWVSQPVDDDHLIITGRAYGKVDPAIWILNLKTMSMRKVGEDIVPAATAPLVRVGDKQWWLIGGEPNSNKERVGTVSIIKVIKKDH